MSQPSSARARRLALGLVVTCLVATAQAWAQPQRGENAPEDRLTRSDDYQHVRVALDEGVDALGPEEQRLVALRQQMRELRQKRREAMREARASGDSVALTAAQDEYRVQMESLRAELQAARGVVLEQQMSENPQLSEALRSEAPASADPCKPGSGEASEHVRRRAYARLVALAPDGLRSPSDIPTAAREELRVHARRTALLRCIRVQARTAADDPSAAEVRRLLLVEQRRHDAAIRVAMGAPPAPARATRPDRAGARRAAPRTEAE